MWTYNHRWKKKMQEWLPVIAFNGEINSSQRLQGFLLDHIIEEATGAAELHKGKGNTSSTQGHWEKREKHILKRRKKGSKAGRW